MARAPIVRYQGKHSIAVKFRLKLFEVGNSELQVVTRVSKFAVREILFFRQPCTRCWHDLHETLRPLVRPSRWIEGALRLDDGRNEERIVSLNRTLSNDHFREKVWILMLRCVLFDD